MNPIGWIKRKLLQRAIKLAITKGLNEMAFLRGIFTSKKLGVLLSGVLVIVFRDVLGLDEATAQQIAQLIVGYLVAQGAVDVAKAIKGQA